MASNTIFLISLILISLIHDNIALSKKTPSTTTINNKIPSAFVFPLSKHALTQQHTTTIHQRTPLAPIKVLVDLSGAFLWVSCGSDAYRSATYESPRCHSRQCSLLHSHNSRPRCNYNTCIIYSENVLTSKVARLKLSDDVLNLHSTNGFNPTSLVSVPRFLFLCAPNSHSKGLPSGAKGIAGLGHGQMGLPSQLSTKFNISKKFSICISPSPNTSGVLFFGEEPYVFSPGIDLSKVLIYTPLFLMPKSDHVSHHEPNNSYDYFIEVSSIWVKEEMIPLNSSNLLAKISTITPYTILETSIYESVTRVFIEKAILSNISRAAPKAPLDICFSRKGKNGEVSKLSVPVIDLVLQDEHVFWRIFGLNSMVQMGNDTMCLGFLDGGLNPRASITIGSYLLEDNLLQFDLVSSRLGFTNLLLLRQTSCASFNFTTNI